MSLFKFFTSISIVLSIGIYASEAKHEPQNDAPILVEAPETAGIQKYNNYLIYGAYLAIIMVIASSASQVQKYLKK